MHLNHYFLAQVAQELRSKLVGTWLVEGFTQNKDELVLAFAKDGEDFYIKCLLGPAFQCLSFASEFHRAKSNSRDLFPKAMELLVTDVQATTNDRSLWIHFENSTQLLFKMHGNKSNVVLFEGNKGIDQFHKSYPDLSLDPNSLAKETAFSMDAFIGSGFDFKKHLPALGKEPLDWLKAQGFDEMQEENKVDAVCELLEILHHPSIYYIKDREGKAILTFFLDKFPELAATNSALEASSLFQRFHFTHGQKTKQKDQLNNAWSEKKEKLKKFIRDLEIKLVYLDQAKSYEQTGDLLMANLHQLAGGIEKVVLVDFYTTEEREIKLKKELSPQKNAEWYYQKAKNAVVERTHLSKTLEAKKAELDELEKKIDQLEEQPLASLNKERSKQENTGPILPYKSFEIDGFEVRVGKTSQKNDELTLKYASKNDLWMHARGYAGSHVIVKAKPGKEFPVPVIEKAAAIAAYYSKGKNDSLCPVIVTERKYVRKPKGMAVGQVVIDKEKVILVKPDLF